MKKIVLILFSFISIGIYGQSTINSYTSTLRFLNSDFLQTYQGARIAVPTMTLPNSLNTYTSTVGFNNTDNAQIYQAIRGLGQAITTGSVNSWNINGNAPITNTNFIGTTNNISLLFKTNNTERLKIDSLGNFTFNSSNLSSGASTTYSINMPINTNQTAGTEIHGIRVVGNGRQWNTTVPNTQREYYFSVGTYSATAPTVFTNIYGAYFDSPNLGTNVSVSGRNYAAGFNNAINVAGGTSLFQGILSIDRGLQSAATCLSINGGSASVNAFQLVADGTNSLVTLNSRSSYSLGFQLNDVNRMTLNSTGLNVLTTMSVQSTSTLTGLRNNGTFTTTSTAMIGGTSAGSATLHVLGTASVSGSSTLTGVQINGNAVLTGSLGSTSKTAGIGYAVGSGSTVTQGTSRTTGVTINAVAGSITLFSAAGSATYQDFTVTNSAVGINDVIVINQRSGTDRYVIQVTEVAAGSFRITFATTGGTTVESPVFNYAIIKGQTN